MSLVDDIFSSIPAPLIDQFGVNATYIKASQNQTYNPETGKVSGATTEIAMKVVISELKNKERESIGNGSYVKIIFSASALSTYYPRTTDSIRYSEGAVSRTAKIVEVVPYRGDNPIMHSVVARLN